MRRALTENSDGIALIGPLTGKRAAYGAMLRSVAFDFQTATGIKCALYDDGADPAQACNAAYEILADGFGIVVGHLNSFCAEACAPIYSRQAIPLLLPAATKTELTKNNNVFRVCPSEDLMLSEFRKIQVSRAPESVGVYSDGSRCGEHLLERYRYKYGDVLLIRNIRDLASGSHVDTLFLFGVYPNLAGFINQLSAFSKPFDVYCSDDAAIEHFEVLLSRSLNSSVSVFQPSVGYAGTSRFALMIASMCISASDKTQKLAWLKTSGFFDAENKMHCVNHIFSSVRSSSERSNFEAVL